MTFRKKPLYIATLFTIVGLILGLTIASNLNFHTNGHTEEADISNESIDFLSNTNRAISEIATVVKPSVVNISSTKTVKTRGMSSPFFNDPFFRRFFGDEFGPSGRPREYKQSGLGSGVIVREDGYILTNNHVIKGADEIKVTLPDSREFTGEIVGTDQKTDLAVIKIDAKNLPAIRIGNSEELKVGETVLAIGNPFGLTATVTSGIVSATGRANVGIADYEDFIQTDAAINPGNSGGALVNIRGQLIGINTAIFSTTGGYQGIGFAIPSSMAEAVMDNLISKGKVVRGWLGVSIQPLTPDLAAQFKLKDDKGILVGDVVEDGPAHNAGIQRGDVIIEFHGKKVEDVTGLRNMVAGTSPGERVNILVVREGKQKSIEVKIEEMSEDEMGTLATASENRLRGIHVQDITAQMKQSLNIPKRLTGVVVTDIEDDSPSGGFLKRGDLILEINRQPVTNTKDYEAVVTKIKTDDTVLLLIFRQNATFYITLSAR
jgi:serine protease Do